jgi:hypothetical protein
MAQEVGHFLMDFVSAVWHAKSPNPSMAKASLIFGFVGQVGIFRQAYLETAKFVTPASEIICGCMIACGEIFDVRVSGAFVLHVLQASAANECHAMRLQIDLHGNNVRTRVIHLHDDVELFWAARLHDHRASLLGVLMDVAVVFMHNWAEARPPMVDRELGKKTVHALVHPRCGKRTLYQMVCMTVD